LKLKNLTLTGLTTALILVFALNISAAAGESLPGYIPDEALIWSWEMNPLENARLSGRDLYWRELLKIDFIGTAALLMPPQRAEESVKRLEEVLEKAGTLLNGLEISDFLSREICFYLKPGRGNMTALFLLDINRSDLISEKLAGAAGKLAAENPSLVLAREGPEQAPVYGLRVNGFDQAGFYWGVRDDLLVLSTVQEEIISIFSVEKPGKTGPFYKNIDPRTDRPESAAGLAVGPVLEAFRPNPALFPPGPAGLKAAYTLEKTYGLIGGLDQVLITADYAPGHLSEKVTLRLNPKAPEEIRNLYLPSEGAGKSDLLRFAFEGTTGYSISRGLKLKELHDYILNLIGSAPADGPRLIGKWNLLQKTYGFDLTRDLLSWIGDETAMFSGAGISPMSPGKHLLVIKSRDRDKALTGLDNLARALAAYGGTFEAYETPGEAGSIRKFTPPIGSGGLYYGASADLVFVALGPGLVEAALKRNGTESKESPFIDPYYKDLLEYMPADYLSLGYKNLESSYLGTAAALGMVGFYGAFVPQQDPETDRIMRGIFSLLPRLAPAYRALAVQKRQLSFSVYDKKSDSYVIENHITVRLPDKEEIPVPEMKE
jgi:hypothetical protein